MSVSAFSAFAAPAPWSVENDDDQLLLVRAADRTIVCTIPLVGDPLIDAQSAHHANAIAHLPDVIGEAAAVMYDARMQAPQILWGLQRLQVALFGAGGLLPPQTPPPGASDSALTPTQPSQPAVHPPRTDNATGEP